MQNNRGSKKEQQLPDRVRETEKERTGKNERERERERVRNREEVERYIEQRDERGRDDGEENGNGEPLAGAIPSCRQSIAPACMCASFVVVACRRFTERVYRPEIYANPTSYRTHCVRTFIASRRRRRQGYTLHTYTPQPHALQHSSIW